MIYNVGNYVKCGDDIFEITVVTAHGIEYISEIGKTEWILPISIREEIKPIELTEEWLIKFDFTKPHDFINTYVNGDIRFDVHKHNPIHNGLMYKNTSGSVIPCCHVHHFQNLVAAITNKMPKINEKG